MEIHYNRLVTIGLVTSQDIKDIHEQINELNASSTIAAATVSPVIQVLEIDELQLQFNLSKTSKEIEGKNINVTKNQYLVPNQHLSQHH